LNPSPPLRVKLANALGVNLQHAQKRYATTVEGLVPSGGSWLDIGCGRQIVPDWAMPLDAQKRMAAKCSTLVGIDVDSAIREHPLLTHAVIAFGDRMPFPDASFDLITANMVIEHVNTPDVFLREIRRVLRPGGRFLFHTPNYYFYMTWIASFVPDAIKHRIVWKLERRASHDIFPTFYRMNTSGDIRAAAAAAGLKVERLDLLPSTGSFGEVPVLGSLEVPLLKVLTLGPLRRLGSNFIAVLGAPG
jgi:SAM-dependent methyltransferase